MVTIQLKAEEEITKEFNYYKHKLGIKREVPLKLQGIGDSGGYNGKNVKLENGVVNQWEKNPQRTKFVLIHELVHAKYDESKNPALNTPLVFPSIILKYLLRELRANTIAYQLLGCNESILEDYFLNYYLFRTNNYVDVSGGYISNTTNMELIKANPIWNKQAIEDAIEYFTSEFRCLRLASNRKIEQLKMEFINQLQE